MRPLAIAALLALILFAAGSARGMGSESASASASSHHSYALRGQTDTATVSAAARAAVAWRGGPVTASTGETVDVFVSDALAAETPEKWAEFLVRLTHGPEIGLLTTYIASFAEVRQLCGARALGCYTRNEMVVLGEPTIDGRSTPEGVARHEYGHHIAFHRANTPWQAIDWGPKQWASAATICQRVVRGEAFPGNEGRNYAQNPGEAWAETYRLMDERKNGITTATWDIIDRSFFPSEAALQAAERDVLQPWTSGGKAVYRRVFGKKTPKVWWIPLQTPLDGELTLSATLPSNGLHEVALVSSNRSTVVRRAQWISQRVKRTATTVCGQRSLFVRVTQRGGFGRVTITASTP